MNRPGDDLGPARHYALGHSDPPSPTGLITTDPSLVGLCRALGASRRQTITQVRLPYAVPLVFSDIKIGTTMAVIGIIGGEFITGNRGLALWPPARHMKVAEVI